ncbi:MAG: IclR family transcriptional regulator [Salinibacter sp.]
MSDPLHPPSPSLTHDKHSAPARYTNTSLEKAFQVLDLFDPQQTKLRVSDLGRELDLSPSSLYPILGTLERHGYLERDADRKFRLGWKLLERSRIASESLDVRTLAKPYLRRIANDYRVNAHLAVLRDWQVLYLDREVAGTEVVFPSIVGNRVPAHCTALGKVLLANLDTNRRDRFLETAVLESFTSNTITDPSEMSVELDDVAQRGWAADYEEFKYGTVCVAAPIRDHEGRVIAAMSVSLSPNVASEKSMHDFTNRLTQEANHVSGELGFDAAETRALN